jgi:CBS domain containing-hemolysin-like protein
MLPQHLLISKTYGKLINTLGMVYYDLSDVFSSRSLTLGAIASRVPVFEERIDNIVGIAYAMEMLEYIEEVCLLIII